MSRRAGLVALAAAVTTLVGCGAYGSPTVAGVGKTVGNRTSSTSAGSTSPTRVLPQPGSPTALVDRWAACERSHGDPNQVDPVIDAHGVINITIPGPEPGGPRRQSVSRLAGDPHDVTGTCSGYLAKAQVALRAAHPVRDPLGVDHAAYMKYVACMRANGIPNYPSPEPDNPNQTDFIGSGVDPNSPSVLRVNDLCGKKLGLPTWWIKGYGPPGDISVATAGLSGKGPPSCAFTKKGCGATKTPVLGPNV